MTELAYLDCELKRQYNNPTRREMVGDVGLGLLLERSNEMAENLGYQAKPRSLAVRQLVSMTGHLSLKLDVEGNTVD
jgi:hypothetical protein